MTTQTLVPGAPPPTGSTRTRYLGAAGVSVVTLGVALAAWRDPAASPLASDEGVLLATFLSPSTVAGVAAVAAGTGLAVALLALTRPAGVPGRSRRTVAAAELVVFGVGFGSATTISLAGYLVAMAMPVVIAVVGVQAVRRYHRVRWVVAGLLAAFVVWGLGTATLRSESLRHLAANLATGFAAAGPRLLVSVVVTAATVAWGLVLLGELHGSAARARLEAFVVRHRTEWTVTAAACALPYGLVRMTWLTPWPLLSPGNADLPADTRLWGLLLGSGSLLGFVLTLGLIRPWGQRFPRWVPRLAGRPVPIVAAAVPGGLVATVVSVSAAPMLVALTFTDAGTGVGVTSLPTRVLAALVFPFWLWGPMLALAVWGYVGHRRRIPVGARS